MSIHTILREHLFLPARDFLYPPVCLLCGLIRDDRNSRICSPCWSGFKRVDTSDPVWIEAREKLSRDGMISDIAACFLFEKEGAFQKAVHLLKYRGFTSVGTDFGRMLGKELIAMPAFASADLIVPVPLHRVKRRERGCNQAELIANGINEVTSIPVEARALERIRHTQSQTNLTIEERRENVHKAFALRKRFQNTMEGKRVILVDDIMTTGATINACATVLAHHGAAAVLVSAAALAG
jgi:ComF family protein